MRRDRVDFRRAAQRLGAWKNLSTDDRQRIDREQRDREEMRSRAARLQAEKKQSRIAARDLLHTLEKVQRETAGELAALERATPGVESHHKDMLLASLCLLVDQVRLADAEYRQLAGLEEGAL
jgi:hypothetical protein